MQHGGQAAVWLAGTSSWDRTKAAYTFAEKLPADSTKYWTAVLEVSLRALGDYSFELHVRVNIETKRAGRGPERWLTA